MSGDTFDFDQGDKETLTGTLHDRAATTGDVLTVQADKSIAAAPGGGAGGVQAIYTGHYVSIGDGVAANITFDILSSGTELLDRTDPANPTFLAGGTYALAVVVVGESLTAAGYANFQLGTDAVAYGGSGDSSTPPNTWGFGMVCLASAGDILEATVTNHDGVSSRNFAVSNAVIVKL